MADFTDKFSGKRYRASTFLDLSASLAAAGDNKVDNRIHEELEGKDAIAKLPFRIKQGDQAKFFPGLQDGTSDGRIETGSAIHPIRDTERGIVYVPIKKKNYQENLIGVGSHVSSTFSPSAYLQVSAAFAQKFSGVSDDTIITYCVEEFYTPTGSFTASRASLVVGTLVAEFDILESGSERASFSAIHSGSILNRDFEYRFPSGNFITHFLMRYDDAAFDGSSDLSSSIFIPSVFVRHNNASATKDTGSINLTNNQFLDPDSGSRIANSGVQRTINGTNQADGSYNSFTFRTRLAGDGDSGSLYSFVGHSQIIIYPSTLSRFGVGSGVNAMASASFQYNSSSRAAATGSSEFKTLYFYSGSGASSLAKADYGFFVSESKVELFNTASGGTPLHTDLTFRTNADVGFYSPSGSQFTSSIFVQTASGLGSGKGPVFAQLYQAGN